MHAHLARHSRRTALLRSGVTASSVAVVLAGFAGTAAAADPENDVRPAEPAPAPPAEAPQPAEAPAAEPVLYEVQPGDHLAGIAAAHGFLEPGAWRRLFDANPQIADPDLIVAGQVFRIPDADEELAPRAVPAPQQAAATSAPQQVTADPGPAPATAPQVNTSQPAGVWDRLAQCESGGNWGANTGNGYYGGLQFSLGSWQAVGGGGYPHEASRGEQIARGQQLQAVQGWGAWPSCSSQLGLR